VSALSSAMTGCLWAVSGCTRSGSSVLSDRFGESSGPCGGGHCISGARPPRSRSGRAMSCCTPAGAGCLASILGTAVCAGTADRRVAARDRCRDCWLGCWDRCGGGPVVVALRLVPDDGRQPGKPVVVIGALVTLVVCSLDLADLAALRVAFAGPAQDVGRALGEPALGVEAQPG